jgi:hypothetical protein
MPAFQCDSNKDGVLLTTCEALHSKIHKLQDKEVIVIHQGSMKKVEGSAKFAVILNSIIIMITK